MNASVEVDRLLKENGAILVRQAKHLVYRLPNGQNFVMAKTPSDPDRAAKNNLSDLRHALGIAREKPQEKREGEMATEDPRTAPVPASDPVREPAKRESLRERLDAAIKLEEAAQEKLLADAQAVERRIAMLKALQPFADDLETEESLRATLPPTETSAPPKPARPPEPPQQIAERVQVTRQLVFAATQTFPETFTVNDVLDLMTGSKEIEAKERLRVRQSIAQAMVTLHERGELIREATGYGKKQAVWKKISLNGSTAAVAERQ